MRDNVSENNLWLEPQITTEPIEGADRFITSRPPAVDDLVYQAYTRGYAKQGLQDAMLEYQVCGPSYWFDEATSLNAWTEEYITARRVEDFRKQYMQEWPDDRPWREAEREFTRMIEGGYTRTQIRKIFLNYYPTMTNVDVNRMLAKYEEAK
jgi:hypothetical protein